MFHKRNQRKIEWVWPTSQCKIPILFRTTILLGSLTATTVKQFDSSIHRSLTCENWNNFKSITYLFSCEAIKKFLSMFSNRTSDKTGLNWAWMTFDCEIPIHFRAAILLRSLTATTEKATRITPVQTWTLVKVFHMFRIFQMK